ncbi:hypothetical protein BGW36DRAFT_361183 [Talaromyces proteolyticus]|uniref:Uncharacterized protein n=1 Tax=Talaromyces proteolyticus TaxID=1131652 RepID=A0AAD4PZ77_9EURO|nr:uncharacterized protein BGW36DRAFT_361183 [Talaromyces proteolyticus]KAH8695487.1 hypothetical protein BGW36DRAFT_361183 [Talaromyces proteolyticus]
MGLRRTYSSCSLSSVQTVDLSSESESELGAYSIRTKKLHNMHSMNMKYSLEYDSEYEASIGSSLSDEEDEEEIIVDLNPRAMAQLPRHLQMIIIEMHAERYVRLKMEDPDIRVMPDDYWIRPLQPVRPTYLSRFPTPLLALPQPIIRNDTPRGMPDYTSNRQAFVQSLGPGNPRRWSAQPTTSGNAFAASQSMGYGHRRHLRRNSQVHAKPEREFRVLNSYHQPLPANLVVNQKHQKQRTRRGSRLKSLSIKPVASNLRDHVKKSFSRLNKWMKA